MYKLFWALSCVVFALMNNVKPYLAGTLPFQEEGYYTSTLGVDDPAAIYASFFAAEDELYQPCNPTYINPPKIYMPGESVVASPDSSGIFAYFTPVTVPSFDECNEPIPEESLRALVAPMAGHITTEPENSYWSSFMEFEGTMGSITYKFVFENMECWYCCVGHTKTASGGYRHQYVEAEDYANTMKKGQFLGLANANTKITIFKDGKEISFTEFYGGKDGLGLKEGVKFTNCTLDATYTPPETQS